MIRTACTSLATASLLVASTQAYADDYNLNVEIIQVRADDGSNATPLDPSNDANLGYVYEQQVNDIWGQAGIQVSFFYSTWDNTEAQRLTTSERNAIYGNTFAAGSGDALPGLGVDRVQIFFVMDHSGTGYNGTAGSGWVGNPLANPQFSARNAGNAQLYIDGTFSSNGRSVMANEGFTSNSLSGTITHEIGHLLGLRHMDDLGSAAGTTQDPIFSVGPTEANLMWESGGGPSYNGGLTLQQNFNLTQEQIDAAIYNGLRLDPDGNGTGVLQVIPEPSSLMLVFAGAGLLAARRRRSA